MQFVKLDLDILDDPKLRRAARRGATQLHLLPWFLAFAKRARDDGRLSVGAGAVDVEDLAAAIPCVTVDQVRQSLTELEAEEILIRDDDGVYRFTAWAKRQNREWKSTAKEAVKERVRKHRARKRDEEPKAPPVVPRAAAVTSGNDVTGKPKSVAAGNGNDVTTAVTNDVTTEIRENYSPLKEGESSSCGESGSPAPGTDPPLAGRTVPAATVAQGRVLGFREPRRFTADDYRAAAPALGAVASAGT